MPKTVRQIVAPLPDKDVRWLVEAIALGCGRLATAMLAQPGPTAVITKADCRRVGLVGESFEREMETLERKGLVWCRQTTAAPPYNWELERRYPLRARQHDS